MDVEGGVASRLGSAFCWPPFCFREEKACVEWGPSLGSHTCLARLLQLSHVPFGSWRLLDSDLYEASSLTPQSTQGPASHLCLLQHLRYCFNIERKIRPHVCQLERLERTAKPRTITILAGVWGSVCICWEREGFVVPDGGVPGVHLARRTLWCGFHLLLVMFWQHWPCPYPVFSTPLCLTYTHSPSITVHMDQQWCLTGWTSALQTPSRDFFHNWTPKRPEMRAGNQQEVRMLESWRNRVLLWGHTMPAETRAERSDPICACVSHHSSGTGIRGCPGSSLDLPPYYFLL